MFKSASINDTLDPEWEETAIDLVQLCDGDLDAVFKIQVFDLEINPKPPVIIGTSETTVNQMVAAGCLVLQEEGEVTGSLLVETAELEGVVNSVANSRAVMEKVAVALQNRSDANEKTETIEALKAETAAAKEAAEAAQKIADEKAQALAEAEGGLSEAVAAAEAAEAEIGGLSS